MQAPDLDLRAISGRAITPTDVYHMLVLFAPLTVWNADDMSPAGALKVLTLPAASQHFHVCDRGSSIVATPKDIFSHERTVKDALQTAGAMAEEVFERGWRIEMAGLDKMTRALWVKLQHLEDLHHRKIEVVNYTPSLRELWIYGQEADALKRLKLRDDERLENN